ncbi:IclR family transcriptional regulator [Nocardioides limicola]|uniref:IclR family transcriptional regulator n=1 Tax=Nocardioides limicola TaxID=2803368 RepID=UPI00193B21CF|nr:IclR family transcriptional regulator C-terminal domain-containing protein [Nocardioides sp. DJM-14]
MPRNDPSPPPEDFVQSVGRALRILEVVSASSSLPVKAIARRCDLNLSTTYHLVRTLAYEGYLHRATDGTYSCGREVARRFYDLLESCPKPPTAREAMRHLVGQTGLSAYLGRLHGDAVVVVDYVEGPGSPYLEDFERGLDVSAHATALGKALLLTLPGRERRALLRRQGMRQFTANTATDVERLARLLARTEVGTLVEEHGEFRDGVACAAMLVPGPQHEPAWALVVSAHGEQVPASARAELRLTAGDLQASGSRRQFNPVGNT